MPHSDQLAASLGALDQALADKFPRYHANLRAGAVAADIERFETFFGRPLPDDVRQMYEWHDGETDPHLGGAFPEMGPWLPIGSVAHECNVWEDCWRIGFQPDWIPLNHSNEPVVAVFDASGSPQDPSPVIEWATEDAAQGRLPSVQAMIDEIVRLLVEDRCDSEDFIGVIATRNDGNGVFPSAPFNTPPVTDRPFRTPSIR